MTEKTEIDNDNFLYSVSAQKTKRTSENNIQGFKIILVKIYDKIQMFFQMQPIYFRHNKTFLKK